MRTIKFCGYEWETKSAIDQKVGPGPNFFADADEALFVDEQGLHLATCTKNDQWFSSEVVCKEPLGFGTYEFTITGDLRLFSPQVVFGAFLYEDDDHEIDIEFSGSMVGKHKGQYVIQPGKMKGHLHIYPMPHTTKSTHRIVWGKDSIEFTSWDGSPNEIDENKIISKWRYEGQAIPDATKARLIFNLWFYLGHTPEKTDNLTISNFHFEPTSQTKQNKSTVFYSEAIQILKEGGIGVIPTDTVYGLVGRADMKDTLERIYEVRERNPGKPCIVLISSINDLQTFGIEVSVGEKEIIEQKKLWPGKVSIVFKCPDPSFEYLTRGTGSLAFRVPDVVELRELIKEVGPLAAPSANIEGEPTSTNIDEARTAFGDKVDFYIDGGEVRSEPSTLVKFEDGNLVVLRQGAVTI